LPVSVDWQQSQSVIRLDGDVGLSSAAELKGFLRQCLSSGKNLVLDLERIQEINISILQLLWAAGRAATQRGVRIDTRVSEAALLTARSAGFHTFPTTTTQD
jgi:anti-anti-sigma regulatory factor